LVSFNGGHKLEVSENTLWKILETERDVIVNLGSHNQEVPHLYQSSNVSRVVLRERAVEPSWKVKEVLIGDWRITVIWLVRKYILCP
jgi:hypothetical protein